MKWARQPFLALLAAGIALAGCDSASAATKQYNAVALADSCTVSITVPNVHVVSSLTYSVRARLTQDCGAVSASWDMNQGQQQASSWWLWNGGNSLKSGQTDVAYYYPGTQPLGAYRATPTGASDTNYYTVPQNTFGFSIKVDSRIAVSGYRSGKNVYVRARVTRFNPRANYGLGSWVNSPGRAVGFYQNRSGWRRVGARVTGRNGYTSYLKIKTPSRRTFRATVSSTPTIWDRTSAAISR